MYLFGVALILLGVILFWIDRRRSTASSVSASRNSIAIGGNSLGPVTNVNSVGSPRHGLGIHWVTIISIIVELAGIAVVFWHIFHPVAK